MNIQDLSGGESQATDLLCPKQKWQAVNAQKNSRPSRVAFVDSGDCGKKPGCSRGSSKLQLQVILE